MGFFKPFALERYFAKHEFAAKYLLCTSDCQSMTVSDLLSMSQNGLDDFMKLGLGYTETMGAPSLRAAIAKMYTSLGSDNIFVHAGAEEAILNLYLATVKQGDTVVVSTPCYSSLSEIPKTLGCNVVPWKLHEINVQGKTKWHLDPDELPKLLGGNKGLIVLNVPHNPTGYLPSKDEFNAIINYARNSGSVLVVDEVYRRLEYDALRQLPSVADAYENGIAIDVLSKHAGLAGLRIGWLASKRMDILNAVAVVKDYNSICSSAPSEFLAEIAVKNIESINLRNLTIIKNNLNLLHSFFLKHESLVKWSEPSAGSIAFPHFNHGINSLDIAEKLVNETGVLLLPGNFYNYDNNYFRIGFGRSNMQEALSIFETWIQHNSKLLK